MEEDDHSTLGIAILIMVELAEVGSLRVAPFARRHGLSRASLYRAVAALVPVGLVARSTRGSIVPGPLTSRLAARRDVVLQAEDATRTATRPKPRPRPPVGVGNLARNSASVRVNADRGFRRTPRYHIAFANAAIDNPWRRALVHSVEHGAVRYRDLIAALSVRHAADLAERQAADIGALIASGVEGLIVSAVSSPSVGEALAEARRRGIPTVLVDRGPPEHVAHESYVTCDDHLIGATMALWLVELLGDRGRVVLLPGLQSAEPAQRRLAGARSVLDRFSDIRILATEWTAWRGDNAFRIAKHLIATYEEGIDGVWCDSGLQAAGSIRAFLATSRRSGLIPPHTGGDLNLTFKLAIRHGVPLAAVDYPPAMGLRAVEILLDLLRGRPVPRRVDVATETVITRHHATMSVKPDLWAEEHVRWDLPDDLVLASGLGAAYDPRSFRVRYRGNRYNRSAADVGGTSP